MLAPVRTSAPAATPISLAEAKAHLRVTSSSDDTLITALVQSATDHLDGWSGILGRALVTQSWRIDFDWFSSRRIRIPLVPVQSITSLAYWDTANADQTFNSGNYALYRDDQGSFVDLGQGFSWPSVYRRSDAIRLTFVAGYGNAASVPYPIKQALLLMVQEMYQFLDTDIAVRSETVDGVGSKTFTDAHVVSAALNNTVKRLVAPYMVLRV